MSGASWSSSGVSPKEVAAIKSNQAFLTLDNMMLTGAVAKNYIGQAQDLFVDESGVTTKTNLTYDAANNRYYTSKSRTAKVLTRFGNTKHDTLAGWINPAPILFDGSGDYITTPDNADFAFGSGPFTLEAFVSRSSAIQMTIMAQYAAYTAVDQRSWYLLLQADGRLAITLSAAGTSAGLVGVSAGAIPLNTRTHVVFVRDGDLGAIFVDGVRLGTCDTTGLSLFNSTEKPTIGAWNISSGIPAAQFNGSMENIRISRVARYGPTSETLTVPTENFVDDADTVLLLLGDQADESTTFTDHTDYKNVEFESDPFIADSIPSTADAYALIQITSGTIGSDFTVEVRREGSSSYATATLTDTGSTFYDIDTAQTYIIAKVDDVDLSAQTSGTAPQFKLTSVNNPDFYFKGWLMQWG